MWATPRSRSPCYAGNLAALLFALGVRSTPEIVHGLDPAALDRLLTPVKRSASSAASITGSARRRFVFYTFYLALIASAPGTVIIPGAPLLGIIFYSQVLNGVLFTNRFGPHAVADQQQAADGPVDKLAAL